MKRSGFPVPDSNQVYRPSADEAGRLALLLGVLLLFHLIPGRVQEACAQGPGWPPAGAGPWSEPPSVRSSSTSTTEAALTLLLPVGAQGIAMGKAMTAVPGPEGVFWNPAGLAGLEVGRFTVFRGINMAGEATAASLILTRQPLGALGVSYHFLDVGSASARDDEGNVVGSLSYRKHLAIVSFGTRVLSGLDAGVNFKVFSDRESCRGPCPAGSGQAGTTYMVDAGIQAVPVSRIPLRLGFMVAHLGPNLQIINAEQADPLPTRVRIGASYEVLWQFLEETGLELWVVGEVEDRWRDPGSPVWYLGGEFLAGEGDVFFLRMGYGQENAGVTSGASVGLGLRYDRFDLSIAKSLSSTSLSTASLSGASEPLNVSLAVLF